VFCAPQVGPRFEVVVFTASLAKYADPLLDLMDPAGLVRWRLFRESCCPYEGNYVKDLNCLGRDLSSTIIVDNSPHSYIFQPANAVPIGTFIDDMEDQELLELLPHLLQVEAVDDVRRYLGPNMMLLQEQQSQQQQAAASVAAVQQQQVLVR
jgi:RNA polymerase II subunit A small phosphatase-like protein